MRLRLMCVVWLGGCRLFTGDGDDASPDTDGTGGETDDTTESDDTEDAPAVPSFSRDVVFLTIGDPQDGVPVAAGWQDALDGWTYAFDREGHDATYECQHDDVGTTEKFELWHWPDPDDGCQAPVPGYVDTDTPPETDPPADTDDTDGSDPFTGQPGTNPWPSGADGWAGVPQGGGCGVWATAMCNRILGVSSATRPPDEAEWDAIAAAIQMKEDGGSNRIDRANYYRDRGYCVSMERFDGDADDYETLVEKVQSGSCDVKLAWGRRTLDGEYVNGHTEVVTGATSSAILTNSWGHVGILEGGSAGGFKHNGEGRWFPADETDGGVLWPPGSTEVTVSYVCPCTFFEELGSMILGGN